VVTSAMLSGLWNVGRSTVRSSTAFLRGRMFHACNVDHMQLPEDPVKRREILDRQNAARRRRNLENPIKFRNMKRTSNQNYYHHAGRVQEHMERNKRPEVLEKRREWERQPAFKQAQSLRSFILQRPKTWRHLTWKSHAPVVYDVKTKHECASCHCDPYLGYRLWWKRHSEPDHSPDHSPELYDCHACFVSDWSRTLPIGYEDFAFGQGNVFRLHDDGGSATTASDSKEKGQ
jgi:hypothetical protein